MNINIDYSKREPIYEQIVKEVERLVSLDILKKGEQILSIRELAYNLGINPNTVKKAYDILENNGIIVSKSTKGTFISDNISSAKNMKIEELIKDINNKINELKAYGLTKEEIFKKIK
ncbi:MAG: GntR family transcriptional regulator [Ruminococcus sp.]|nr:GntR family transcriptional regulator [Ruminococcus sp.]